MVNDRAEIIAADAVLDDQSYVEARAAHIGHNHVLVAERLCNVVRTHQTDIRPLLKVRLAVVRNTSATPPEL